MVHATRARKEAHTRCPIFLLWKTVVSIDNTVSTKHARVPGATRTDFQVAGIARLRMKTCIRQDHHLTVKLRNQRLQMRIMDIGRGTIPGKDSSPIGSG